MLFNSYPFIFLFLPLTLMAFFAIGRYSTRLAAGCLVMASLFFYSYWSIEYLWLLLASISVNYLFALAIFKRASMPLQESRRALFWMAVSLNLLLLAYYKYSNFFLQTVNQIALMNLPEMQIVLPLGISFFTFTQIAFLVDTYKGKVEDFDFLHYVLFITYFPHLIAGPILHHDSVIPQFEKRGTYSVNWLHMASGILLFSIGLCKKVFWADSLAPFADSIFDEAAKGLTTGVMPTSYEAWAGALAYTLQIYFDFSGYTDMALGIALMFNTKLPINFNSPYKAVSIIDFWRRWHMSLSAFLRDYLYIPLGGSRGSQLLRYRNLLLTMLIGGIWHGAGWTFVAWGALHGALLCVNHVWREFPSGRYSAMLPRCIRIAVSGSLTFVAIVVTWVFFRAQNLDQAFLLLNAMFGIAATPIAFDSVIHGQLLVRSSLDSKELAQLIFLGLLWVWLLPNSNQIRFKSSGNAMLLAQIVITVLVLCLSINRFGSYSPFLYYQF